MERLPQIPKYGTHLDRLVAALNSIRQYGCSEPGLEKALMQEIKFVERRLNRLQAKLPK